MELDDDDVPSRAPAARPTQPPPLPGTQSAAIPVVPLSYARRGLPQWRRPMVIPIAGILCMLVAGLGFVRSLYFELPAMLDLHQRTLPPPSAIPPTPLPTPTVKPMAGDFIGETGLPQGMRRQLIEAIASRTTLLPDRHVMLDRLLAEVGADFVGATALTADLLDRLRVEQRETGPDTKGLEAEQPLLGSLVIHGPHGTIEVNNCDATFVRRNGGTARVEVGTFTDYSGTTRWTMQEIETKLAQFGSGNRITVNATQAAQVVAAVRSWTPPERPRSFQATPVNPHRYENGTIGLQIPESDELLWILPNGATVRVPNGAHDLDPATGVKRWSPPTQLTWIPVSRGITRTLVWISYVDLLVIAGLFILAATLLVDWRWARTALHLWVVGRVAILVVTVVLSLIMVMQIQEELAARKMQPAPGQGLAFAMGSVLGAAAVALIVPTGLFIVLMLPGVRRYHTVTGLRPSVPPATRRRLAAWTGTSAGRGATRLLTGSALLLAALHGTIGCIALADPDSTRVWPMVIASAGLCLTGGIAVLGLRWLNMSRQTNGPMTATTIALIGLTLHPLGPATLAAESAEDWKANLRSENGRSREHAFKQLEQSVDGQVWLLQAMRDSADRVLQENVIRITDASWSRTPDRLKEPVLGEVKKTVPVLVEVVIEDRGQISWSAAGAVRRLGHYEETAPRLCEALATSNDAKTRERIMSLLYTLTPRRADVTAAMVGRLEDEDRDIVQTAGRWLMQKPSENLPAIVAGLDSDRPQTRQLCIGIIAAHQKTADAAAIIPRLRSILLEDPDPEVQQAAARALGQFPGDGPKALLDVIRAAPNARRLELAADNVGANPKANPAVTGELAKLMDDPRPAVRLATVLAFDDTSEMRKRVPVTKLFAMLDDPDESVRKRTAVVVLNEVFTFNPGYVTRAKAERIRRGSAAGRAGSSFAAWPDLAAPPQFEPYVPPPADAGAPRQATGIDRLILLSQALKPWVWGSSLLVAGGYLAMAIPRRWCNATEAYPVEAIDASTH